MTRSAPVPQSAPHRSETSQLKRYSTAMHMAATRIVRTKPVKRNGRFRNLPRSSRGVTMRADNMRIAGANASPTMPPVIHSPNAPVSRPVVHANCAVVMRGIQVIPPNAERSHAGPVASDETRRGLPALAHVNGWAECSSRQRSYRPLIRNRPMQANVTSNSSQSECQTREDTVCAWNVSPHWSQRHRGFRLNAKSNEVPTPPATCGATGAYSARGIG
jgi:hypothetical protein